MVLRLHQRVMLEVEVAGERVAKTAVGLTMAVTVPVRLVVQEVRE